MVWSDGCGTPGTVVDRHGRLVEAFRRSRLRSPERGVAGRFRMTLKK
jgi:hypothetical protein